MKRMFLVSMFLLLFAARSHAQTVTLTASWDPNPATDNVVNYVLQLDAATPVNVLPSVCTPTTCVQTFAVVTGNHTITLVAQNLLVDTDPTSLQSSAPASVTFKVSNTPGKPANVKVKR